jgi:oligopeptide/dipeptide ABC transporter ATP-binding protein
MDESNSKPLLQIEDLAVTFPGSPGGPRFRAVDHIDLAVYPGQTLAVVGESGSGKSVTAMSVLQLIPTPPGRFESGSITWQDYSPTADTERAAQAHRDGQADASAPAGEWVDLMRLREKQMRHIRGDQIAMIFQEPMTSLNPVYTIGEQIREAILLHQKVDRKQADAIAEQALGDVGIAEPSQRLKEYPHQMSGGMRQRVMIAMALACQPRLLLADEPTTALDVTIQAQILELLRHLQHERHMAMMLITHDLGVVAENADVVAVMFGGRVVEFAAVEEIFDKPMHPYTRGLLKSMPVIGRPSDRLPTVVDGATIPEDFPEGFEVAPHEVNPTGRYGGEDAKLYEVAPQHWVLCTAKTAQAEKAHTLPQLSHRRAPQTVG